MRSRLTDVAPEAEWQNPELTYRLTDAEVIANRINKMVERETGGHFVWVGNALVSRREQKGVQN